MSRPLRILTRRERDRPATWEDLDEVPEGYIGEIVAGEIVATPRPNAPHMKAAGELNHSLGPPSIEESADRAAGSSTRSRASASAKTSGFPIWPAGARNAGSTRRAPGR